MEKERERERKGGRERKRKDSVRFRHDWEGRNLFAFRINVSPCLSRHTPISSVMNARFILLAVKRI